MGGVSLQFNHGPAPSGAVLTVDFHPVDEVPDGQDGTSLIKTDPSTTLRTRGGSSTARLQENGVRGQLSSQV